MTAVPNRLASHMSRKQYLHSTNLLVEAVNLGKGTLDGVESLKELSLELEQKKEVTFLLHQVLFYHFIDKRVIFFQQLHVQLLSELKTYLYIKPSQHILALRRQNSGREGFFANTPLRRSTEIRKSGRNRSAVSRNIFNDVHKYLFT